MARPNGGAPGFFRSATAMLLNTPEFRKNDAADLWQDWNFRISINDSLKAIAGVEYLRGMPGQKHVVLVTGC